MPNSIVQIFVPDGEGRWERPHFWHGPSINRDLLCGEGRENMYNLFIDLVIDIDDRKKECEV